MNLAAAMTPHDENVNTRINQLYADYRQQLPERIGYIAEQFAAYRAQPGSPTALHHLHSALHKLAGSGATFGHTEMGKIARQWEHVTGSLLSSSTPASSSLLQEMQSLLAQLSRAATLPDQS